MLQQLQLVRTRAREDFCAQVQKMFLVKHLVGSNAPLQHMVQSYANVGSWCTTHKIERTFARGGITCSTTRQIRAKGRGYARGRMRHIIIVALGY